MSRQTQDQRPLPSHPQFLEYRAPKSNPPTHAQAYAPRLRKSMSRVLSRVISITRKEPPPSQATLREGNERVFHIDRGYEVIPRVTSTHLKRSQNGLREVETNVQIPDRQHIPHRVPKEYPFYSHPQISHPSTLPPLPTNGPGTNHRQAITTKLSRNQIASFRKASASSSSQASISSSTTRSTQTRITAGAGSDLEPLISDRPMKRGYRDHPGPKRHLASSRSTAEMRGRSSGESTRPSSSSEEDWATTPVPDRRLAAAKSNTSASVVKSQLGSSPTPYQFVCPERLIQQRPTAAATPPANPTASSTPTFSRPRPPAKCSTPHSGSYRKPVPSFDSSPCSTTIEIASDNPDGIRMSFPVSETSSQSLDELFDEVMNACLTDGIEDDQTPLLNGHIGWEPALSPMSSPSGPVTPGYRGKMPLKSDSPTPTKTRSTRPMSLEPQRFIPSGRSFEPLRKNNTGPLRIPSITQASPGKDGSKVVKMGSKVKDAIAKFEMRNTASVSDPSTPVRVLGNIINRPSSVSSAGLSEESRRLMWEARQSRGIR